MAASVVIGLGEVAFGQVDVEVFWVHLERIIRGRSHPVSGEVRTKLHYTHIY